MNKFDVCGFCPFMSDKVEVPYAGSKNASVIMVGDTPHHEEERKKVPFAGKSAALISKVLDTTNLSKRDVFFTNACRCGFNKDTDSTKDINQALRQCRNFLSLAIKQMQPKLIIVMGAYALQQVLGKKSIMKNRGKFVYSEEYECNVFITVNPRYSLRGANKDYPNIKFNMMSMQEKMPFQDFKQVARFFDNGCKPPTIDENYHEVPDFNDYRDSSIVAFDYETTGLNVYDPAIKLLSVSMSMEKGVAGVYVFDDHEESVQHVHPSFKEIMENPSIDKVVASRPFDESFSKVKLGIDTKGKVHDVLQMAHLVDENYYQYNLESVSDVYTDLSSIKDLAEGMRATLIDAPRETLINYSGVDSDATLRSFHSLKEEINKDKYLPTYYNKFVLPTQEMFRQIEYNGCKIDTKVLKDNESYAIELKEELHQKAIEELPEAIREDKKHKGNLRLSRSALIVDYLFTHKKGLRLKPSPRYITPKNKTPRTCEEHLVMFDHIPFVSYLLRWKKVEKVYGSYIKNLWGFISEGGFIHPSTLLTRTVTGRTVMLGPAIQTYPKRGEFAKLIREAVVAEEGWLLADRDLGQSELRIHAWLANDRMLLDAFDAGVDPHKQTAAMVSQKKIEDVTPEERQGAKGINFGAIFGSSAKGLSAYIRENYGVDYSVKECEGILKTFFARPNGYFKMAEYNKAVSREVGRKGFVRSPLGRLRRLPNAQGEDWRLKGDAERQAINFRTQSFSSDLALIAMFLFNQAIQASDRLRDSVKVLFFIHDAIMFTAKKEVMNETMALLKDCMQNRAVAYVTEHFKDKNGKPLKVGYPVITDGNMGLSWAGMEEMEEVKEEWR